MGDLQIREAQDADADAFVRLVAEANPNLVITPESWRHRRRNEPARAQGRHLVAEIDGDVVACARSGLNAHTTAESAAFGSVVVSPARRRAGIGTALVEQVERRLGEIGARTWTTVIFESEAGMAFARHHGFRDERSAVVSAVDPRTVELPSTAHARCVEVVPAAELGAEVVFEVDSAGALDEPLAHPPAPMPFDEWRAEIWDEPSFTAEGSFVTLCDGTPAAIALLFAAPGLGRAVNAFTATLPSFRGRGLALAAKIGTMRWAAANGITDVWTANDDTNAPMLAINARLGYTPRGRLRTVQREL